jgi:hypothetical protein
MNRPTIEDAEKAIRDARPHLDRAAGTDDDAVKADRWKQASMRLAYAARVLEGLAAAAAPPEPAPGPSVNFGAPGRPAVFAPGPR